MQLTCGRQSLDISSPVIMGILNTTPDSFSDGGGCYTDGRLDLPLTLSRAEKMLSEGASIIDVGGESTRPGAEPISEQEEMDRVLPVVEQLVIQLGCIVSVDTSRASVIREAAALGAGIVNDVRALACEGAMQEAAKTGLPVCLMHMQGQPNSMQVNPQYQDIESEVVSFLTERIEQSLAAGIQANNIILDPGFGFGKSLAHNLTLLKGLDRILALGFPLLVGLSRKSLIGALLNKEVGDRVLGSVCLAQSAVQRGAHILRVHDVAETADMLKIVMAIRNAEVNS